MKIRLFEMAVAGAVAATLSATTALAQDNVNVRYSWKLKGEYAAFYTAQEQGLFAENDLTVRLGEGAGSSAALSGLIQGDEDVVVMPAVFALSAISQGLPVKIVALYHPATPLGILSFPDAPVTQPSDLEGKSLPTSPGDTLTTYLPAFCEINNIDCASITLVSMAPETRPSQFMTRRVDMLGTYLNVDAPVLDATVDEPFVKMAMSDFGLVLPGLSVVTSEANLEEKPEVIARFLESVTAGMQVSIDDPDAAAEAMEASWATPPTRELLVEQIVATNAAIPRIEGRPLGWVEESTLQQALDLLSSTGAIETVLPVGDYYTNEMLK